MDELYTMTKTQVEEGVKRCQFYALLLAEKALKNIDGYEIDPMALGLFSFAIEEFGKALLLEEFLEKDYEEYQIPTYLFGGEKAHSKKFNKALSQLPKEVKSFSKTVIDEEYTDCFGNPLSYDEACIGDIDFHFGANYSPVDLDLRMNCFYVDWDDEKKQWKDFPPIQPNTLRFPISSFIETIKNRNSEKFNRDYKGFRIEKRFS